MIYRYENLFLKIDHDGKFITRIEFSPEATETEPQGALEIEVKYQLDRYFSGDLRVFDLPYTLQGTEFQQKCWRALASIPYGQTVSYAEIAGKIGHPRACRAVGNANHNNPLPILLPCHRVVGSGGELRGFAGGLELKKYLLELEKK
ncbi:MAG TPA: methylated-DNA--[protein]-cysteine S-methyltransferase [Candidatus Cloacimonadota bacterium]|nr:methylated-DNA--[protein]-cysteine S-methyltransferase [Candidatus Cloacimonadota bacterium]HPS38998.1 methylated-DNA--[protein]-cysteine S-methyltransferase [Candidatus Cloacimonadota bacterium]